MKIICADVHNTHTKLLHYCLVLTNSNNTLNIAGHSSLVSLVTSFIISPSFNSAMSGILRLLYYCDCKYYNREERLDCEIKISFDA